jgi:hypothetical protein
MSTPAPQLPLAVRQVLWQRIWDRLLQPLSDEVTSRQHSGCPSLPEPSVTGPEEGS